MKILKILLMIIVAIAVIIYVGSVFLPKIYSVKRTIFINAPDSIVYRNVSEFRKFVTWNPWYKMEPTAKIDISGPVSTPGHLYKWSGEEMGEGQMLIKQAVPNSLVDFELKFLKPFENTADTKFSFVPAKGGTNVIWEMSGENTDALDKWMGLCMDGIIGKDFESGLKNLKETSEKL